MKPDLERLIDTDDLAPDELARLQRVHDLLLKAGPPADLPATLARPQAPVIPFPAKRGRPKVLLLLAATLAAVFFGGGYLVADTTRSDAIHVVRVVSLQGAGQDASFASLRIGPTDLNGNRSVELAVSGLHPLAHEYTRYLLMLSKGGKPTLLCGTFAVGASGTTTVRFSVPYAVSRSTRWVVTQISRATPFPGRVVMTTV